MNLFSVQDTNSFDRLANSDAVVYTTETMISIRGLDDNIRQNSSEDVIPGYFTPGQHASNGILQIPHTCIHKSCMWKLVHI